MADKKIPVLPKIPTTTQVSPLPKIVVETQPTEKIFEAAQLLQQILNAASHPNVVALLKQPKVEGEENEAQDLASFALNELSGICCILSEVVSDNMPPKKESPSTN